MKTNLQESDPSQMSRRERQLFDILVSIKKGTLTEIMAQMEDSPTRQGVRALLVIMERKGYVRHEKKGREFFYSVRGFGKNARRLMFRDLVRKVFGNSLKDALASHLDDDEVHYSEEELEEIRNLFEKLPKKRK